MSTESLICRGRTYMFESRVTERGHRYIMVTEQSSRRQSKLMVFHDHFDAFRAALERAMAAEPEGPQASV